MQRAASEGCTVVEVYHDVALAARPAHPNRRGPARTPCWRGSRLAGSAKCLPTGRARIARNQRAAHHIQDRLKHCGAPVRLGRWRDRCLQERNQGSARRAAASCGESNVPARPFPSGVAEFRRSARERPLPSPARCKADHPRPGEICETQPLRGDTTKADIHSAIQTRILQLAELVRGHVQAKKITSSVSAISMAP
jgi:hypothetical protein